MGARGRPRETRPLFPRDEHAENAHDSHSSTTHTSRRLFAIHSSCALRYYYYYYYYRCYCIVVIVDVMRRKIISYFSAPAAAASRYHANRAFTCACVILVSADYWLSNEFHVPVGFVQQIRSVFFPRTFTFRQWEGTGSERRAIVARLGRFQPTRFPPDWAVVGPLRFSRLRGTRHIKPGRR